MTQRERQASTAMSDAVPRPGHSGTPRPQPAAELSARPPLWEDFYRHATPAQQNELLALSRRQGVVYAHQLPPSTNGNADERPRQLLARLLAGKVQELGSVPPVVLDFVDGRLDATQREAVVGALTAPDIYLVQGLPGTGKSLVSAEIVTQAVRRGERVLLLGATSASIDRVLSQVAGREAVCAIRCLAAGEAVEALPPAIRRLTVAARCRELREEAIPAAHREQEAAEQRRDRRRRDEPILQQCGELAEIWAQLEDQAAALQKEREALAAEVERAAAAAEAADETASTDELAKGIAAAARSRRDTLTGVEAAEVALRQRHEDRQRESDALAPELESLRPLGEAKQQGRWWTGVWWQATFAGNVPARLAELEKRCRHIEAALAELEEEKRLLTEQRSQAEQSFQQERQSRMESERVRRAARLDEQATALEQDRKLLQEKWQLRCRDLSVGTAPPVSMTPTAVTAARDACRCQLERDEQQASFSREWAAGLASLADNFPAQLAAHANLAAATTTSIAADEWFGDATGASFDLLVLEEAQRVTESEFLAAARRARRWVLVGEPDQEGPTAPVGAGNRDRSNRSRSMPASVAPRLFHRLWQGLHFDPRSLPYAWEREGDRLCCRLRRLAADQRQWLECERVADFPDIELRILALPRGRPVLAEVVFPPTLSIHQAKEYIFRELQELPVRARSHSMHWREEPDRLVLCLCDGEAEDAVAVDLGSGVRELVGGACGNGSPEPGNWHTCRLEFDRQAGWQRSQAEEWVRRHTGARDLGRTTRLDVPHRMHPELAAVLSGWLFAGGYRMPPPSADEGLPCGGVPVQFIPVPPAPSANGSGKGENGRRGRTARGGAGLELDLSDPRHRDRLPAELRPELPARGLVNYLEAQAVVRALEKLAATARDGLPTSVAVLALYPAQVELIRCLLRRTPALTSCGLDIDVDVPEAFRERECSIVLLSLTRSHPHRAVTFGEGPHVLVLGLTRARSRILLFGDLGTLARRVQWDGAVDHLNEAGASQERDLLHHLVRYFHSDGDLSEAAPVPEGSRT